jgi:PAS domain S-box-containing protein
MDSAQSSSSEKTRLTAVSQLNLLDTNFEDRFDRITRLISRIFKAPAAGISLVDKGRVWYKSVVGFQFREIERQNSFSTHAIESDGIFIIPDTFADDRFKNNSLVIDGPKIRFFAGFPLMAEGGENVGCLFIADRIPRNLSEIEVVTIKDLAYWAELELRRKPVTTNSYVGNNNQKTLSQLTAKNRELENEKARQEVMIESIGDGVIGISDKGEVVFANKQVEAMLGWSEEELKGKRLVHAVKLVDDKGNEVLQTKRPIRNALFTRQKVSSNDYFYVRRDGSKFPAAITATPVVLHGQVIGGVNVFRDITKEYEIDKMKTEFISLASHQLRTPLSAMKWFSEMLADGEVGELSDEQKELVDNIYQSNERMIGLVNSILNISRIESGRMIIDPKPTDLKKLVEEVILELQPKIEEKKHAVAVSVHEGLPKINIDPKLVRHVYMNLLTNSIKYTPEGGEITVIISKSGNEVISQITDNGLGIPKRQQDKVFTKFFRAQNIAKVVTDGTGLGLYLTKSIVDSSGGKIWFESEEGKGTTFWLILPLAGSHQKEGEVSIDS